MFTNLEDRHDHDGEEHVVAEVVTDRPSVTQHGMTAQHITSADHPQYRGGCRSENAGQGQRLHHVGEQSIDTDPEDAGLPLFGMVALDYANSAERFGQPSGNLGVDFGSFTKDGPDLLERILQNEDEQTHDGEYGECNEGAAMQEIDEGQNRSKHPANEFHEPGADQITYALNVRHDARDQGARAVFVVVSNRE